MPESEYQLKCPRMFGTDFAHVSARNVYTNMCARSVGRLVQWTETMAIKSALLVRETQGMWLGMIGEKELVTKCELAFVWGGVAIGLEGSAWMIIDAWPKPLDIEHHTAIDVWGNQIEEVQGRSMLDCPLGSAEVVMMYVSERGPLGTMYRVTRSVVNRELLPWEEDERKAEELLARWATGYLHL